MNSRKITSTDLFLAILALLLVSVSFYQTWIGLQQIFGGSSLIISLVLSLLLLFLCWMLRSAKLEGRPTAGILGIYAFIASFCFIANFNALYTRFMKTDIYSTEVKTLNEKFNNLETEIQSNLGYKYDKATAQNIEIKKKQLIEQIKDPANKGIGTKAQSLIKDIEKLSGQKVDLLTPLNNDYEDLSERMGKQIDNILSDLSSEEQSLKNDVNKLTTKWNTSFQEFLLLPKDQKDEQAQGLIDASLSEYNKLGIRANSVLSETKFKFEPYVSETENVGKIGYAFQHALDNFGMYQFVVLAGCILLDFVIVIIIMIVTNPTNTGTNSNGSVFSNRRQGKTLIPNN